MCATCGCGADEVRVSLLPGPVRGHDDLPSHTREAPHEHAHPHDQAHEHAHPHEHHHPHDHNLDHDHEQAHPHDHHHDHLQEPEHEQPDRLAARTHTVTLEQAVLAKNDHQAAANRGWLAARGLTAINLMSSPGSGKTTLLERTIAESGLGLSVIEGDQETTFDAERIRAAGARAVQVNTGSGCHLDAAMIERALHQLQPDSGIVVIENVGNLVCPALFDLGEAAKVVVISVTEGDDKPLKYPHMFAAADLVVVNKIDLLPYVDFDLERLTAAAEQVRPGVQVLPVSARTGQHLDAWYRWLERARPARPAPGALHPAHS